MDTIYYIIGLVVLAYIVTYAVKKWFPTPANAQTGEVPEVAPYKVEPPVQTVAVEPVVAEAKVAAPELKVVTGTAPKAKKTTAAKPSTKTAAKPVAKKSAAPKKKPVARKPRVKKPTDNA